MGEFACRVNAHHFIKREGVVRLAEVLHDIQFVVLSCVWDGTRGRHDFIRVVKDTRSMAEKLPDRNAVLVRDVIVRGGRYVRDCLSRNE